MLMRRVRPSEARASSAAARGANTSGPRYPAARIRKAMYLATSAAASGRMRKLCVMRSRSWRSVDLARVASSSGWPNSTICRSLWRLASRFGSVRPRARVGLCETATRSARSARDTAPRLFLLGRIHPAAHPAVERGAVDAEQLRRLADIAARQAQRRFDVAALPGFEGVVEVEAARALELAQRLLGDRARALPVHRHRRRFELELGLEVRARH